MTEGVVVNRAFHAADVNEAEFWAAIDRSQLMCQQCRSCSLYQYYPRGQCRYCHSTDIGFEAVDGAGTVYSYSTVWRAPDEFAELVPYTVAVVELDEGPRMATRLIGVDVNAVNVGDRVRVAFVDDPARPGSKLPLFGPEARMGDGDVP